MNKKNLDIIKFYEFLNGDITKGFFENWVDENKSLKELIGNDGYQDLLAFNFRGQETKSYIKSVIKKQFDWKEFEKWRTIELLKKIERGDIEIVLATRKLKELYLDQEEEMERPLISVGLGLGYESELDNCPIQAEYDQWNTEALKKQLEPVSIYERKIRESAKEELTELLNPEHKSH